VKKKNGWAASGNQIVKLHTIDVCRARRDRSRRGVIRTCEQAEYTEQTKRGAIPTTVMISLHRNASEFECLRM
jgi:hypothetical protein